MCTRQKVIGDIRSRISPDKLRAKTDGSKNKRKDTQTDRQTDRQRRGDMRWTLDRDETRLRVESNEAYRQIVRSRPALRVQMFR